MTDVSVQATVSTKDVGTQTEKSDQAEKTTNEGVLCNIKYGPIGAIYL